jgi:hypothetical protein
VATDHLVAVRPTPQGKVTFEGVADELFLDDATFRVLGLTGLSMPPAHQPEPWTASLTSTRANTAARVLAHVTDPRSSTPDWDMVKARVVDLPESITFTKNFAGNRFSIELNRRSGRVVLLAQPPNTPSSNPEAENLIGVGLAKADIDSLPTFLQLDLLGPFNDLQSTPFNDTPPSDYTPSGFRIETDGDLVARGLQLATVAKIRPTGPVFFWSDIAASIIEIKSDTAEPPGLVWIWTPSAPNPGASASIGDWDDVTTWLGYRIESPALVTLQLQSYKDHTTTEGRWWNDPAWAWELNAELQMKDYRGEVTVDHSLFPTGDTDAGPGQWYLRVPDGLPFSGQIVFGNTGGWFSNRPRIFAPFVLPVSL